MMKTKIPGIPGFSNQVEALQIYLRKAGLQQYIPLSLRYHRVKRKMKPTPEEQPEEPIQPSEKKPKKRSTPEEQPEEPIQPSEKKQKRNRLRKNNRNRRFNREQNEPRQRNSDSRHKAFFEFFLGRNNYSIGLEF